VAPSTPRIEYEDQQRVASHIQFVGEKGRIHGYAGIFHSSLQSGTGIVNADAWKTRRRDVEVDHGGLHDRAIRIDEEKSDELTDERKA